MQASAVESDKTAAWLYLEHEMIDEHVSIVDALPEPGTRWVASRKEAVVQPLLQGKVTEEQILTRYPDLSLEELQGWTKRFKRFGRRGLSVTHLQS